MNSCSEIDRADPAFGADDPHPTTVVPTAMPADLSKLRHDLRTPVNHILGYSELLIEDAEDNWRDDLVSPLRLILAHGRAALSAIDQIRAPEPDDDNPGDLDADLAVLADRLRLTLNPILDATRLLREGNPALAFGRDLDRIDDAVARLVELARRASGS